MISSLIYERQYDGACRFSYQAAVESVLKNISEHPVGLLVIQGGVGDDRFL